jgi:hypothetical protein
MSRLGSSLWSALVCVAALGCEGFIGGDSAGGPAGLDTEPAGNALPVDHPALDAPLTSAGARRLSIEQLRRTLPVVLGNDLQGQPITWKIGSKQGLDEHADTLGEADYVDSTEDNLEPSPLYLKLVDDAARDVCTRALAADAARTDPTTRSVLRHPDDVDRNFRYLRLRFHGVRVDETDAAAIAPLRKLFEQATAAADTNQGWHVVCVALLTAPEFHLY